MDFSTIQADIQNEIQSIVNIMEKIQSEIKDLNNFTKAKGPLDSAVKEGLESSERFFKMSGCALTDKDMETTELHTIAMSTVLEGTQNRTNDQSSQNNTTQ